MITAEETVELLQAAVRLRGEDYVYPTLERPIGTPTCVYFEADGTPSCIVGLVGSMVGVTPQDIKAQSMVWDEPIFANTFDKESIDILDTAQFKQDARYTWGEALDAALRVHNEYKDGIRASNSDD